MLHVSSIPTYPQYFFSLQNYQRVTISLEHLYFFLQQWIPCHFTLALSWMCACVLCLSVPLAVLVFTHMCFTTRDHIIQKTCFQRHDWCIGVCLSLSWLWHTINVGLRRYSIAQNIKLSKTFLYLEEYRFPSQPPIQFENFKGSSWQKIQWSYSGWFIVIDGRKQNYLSKLVWLIGKLASR